MFFIIQHKFAQKTFLDYFERKKTEHRHPAGRKCKVSADFFDNRQDAGVPFNLFQQ